MNAKVISVCIQKGGSGKTTTVSSLASALAADKQKVLMVDMDPQANLSEIHGLHAAENNIYPLLVEVANGTIPTLNGAVASIGAHLSLLPAHINLAAGEVQFVHAMSRETLLRRLIEPLREEYDLILIDTPPSVGIFTINSLVAADYYLVPVEPEYLALKGLDILVNTVSMVGQTFNPNLDLLGVLITKFDGRKVISRNVEELVRQRFEDKVFATKIRDNVALVEAQASHQSIFEYNQKSYGAIDYLAVAQEIMQRLS